MIDDSVVIVTLVVVFLPRIGSIDQRRVRAITGISVQNIDSINAEEARPHPEKAKIAAALIRHLVVTSAQLGNCGPVWHEGQ
jgi:hypothetical protein